MNWADSFRNKKFRIEFFITIFSLALILTALANFLNFIETRNGVLLDDPLLSLLNPADLTWFIFGLIYASLITALISFSIKPHLLMTAVQSYVIMIIFRIAAMYLLPLDPPEGMIPLTDPFVEFFGTGQLLTKDLFFSGHTATLFLLYLLAEMKSLKIFFLISTLLVAVSVLLQHVHYSIDIFSAPFFAYCSYKAAGTLRIKLLLSAK